MREKIKLKYILICLALILVIIFTKFLIDRIILHNQMKTATHAITINENVNMYTSAKEGKKSKELKIGTNVYILKNIIDKKGVKWCKVKVEKNVGYILKENLKSYKKTDMKKDLMLDVSKFNMENNFSTIGEFKAFLLNNNIKYVYIRAGGRGYGEAGNFYTDTKYKEYAEACEYLNIPFGFYFLDEAITSKEVDEEVEFINNFISDNKYTNNILPIALDVEKHVEKGRADSIWDTRYILINELIQKLEQNDKKVILYSNANIANKYLVNVNAKLWLAYYPEISDIPDYWYSNTDGEGATNKELISKMVGWQFTETGVKNKIDTKIDLSIVYNCFFKDGNMNDIKGDINGRNKFIKTIFNLKSKSRNINIFTFYQ